MVGSSQGVRLASGRGWEGLPKASADTPPIILNSLHTDFFFFFKLQSINKNETKTPDLKTIHGIRYKSRTAVQGDVTVLNIARSKQEESVVLIRGR